MIIVIPVSVKRNHSSREETTLEYSLSEHQIRGRIGVSAAGLQGKVLNKRSVYVTDTGTTTTTTNNNNNNIMFIIINTNTTTNNSNNNTNTIDNNLVVVVPPGAAQGDLTHVV